MSESRFADYLEGWVDEKRESHDDHDVLQSLNDELDGHDHDNEPFEEEESHDNENDESDHDSHEEEDEIKENNNEEDDSADENDGDDGNNYFELSLLYSISCWITSLLNQRKHFVSVRQVKVF